MTPDEVVKEALNEFDFDKVHNAMKAVGWEWFWCGVPSPDEIRQNAERSIRELLDRPENIVSHGSGGLYARRRRDGDFKVRAVRLEFVLEAVEVTCWDEPLEPIAELEQAND